MRLWYVGNDRPLEHIEILQYIEGQERDNEANENRIDHRSNIIDKVKQSLREHLLDMYQRFVQPVSDAVRQEGRIIDIRDEVLRTHGQLRHMSVELLNLINEHRYQIDKQHHDRCQKNSIYKKDSYRSRHLPLMKKRYNRIQYVRNNHRNNKRSEHST
ncbi:hypothetical protein D3C78_1385920 [compost metagenome]